MSFGPQSGDTLQAITDGSGVVQKLDALQRLADNAVQRMPSVPSVTSAGLPEDMRLAMENASGIGLNDVRVHRNSSAPAQIGAHAYAQGRDIHLAPGQDRHLPHEAWHVVQQAQGRVRPTQQVGGVNLNDDPALEREATTMGERAIRGVSGPVQRQARMPGQVGAHAPIQRAKTMSAIFDFIDGNREDLGDVGGAHMLRLMYWNDLGHFDTDKGGILNLKTVRKAMDAKVPLEKEKHEEDEIPDFMQVRSRFAINLPEYFGGGKLWFNKRPANVVFEGRGWISENIYWRSPGGGEGRAPRVRYMIHAIIEWNNKTHHLSAPKPHITLRNADTQVKIDLDTTNPKSSSRIEGDMEVTSSSFSQGLKVNREPGGSMRTDHATFADLKSPETQQWLKDLKAAAQEARFAEYHEVEEELD